MYTADHQRDGDRPRAGSRAGKDDVMTDTVKTADKQQINLRLDPETADKFKHFCEESGLNQAQGFDHMVQILEMDKAKSVVPEQSENIETFEMHSKALNEAYLKAVENGANAKALALEQFRTDLENKDKTIADLRARLESAEAAQKASESTVAAALQSAAQADKDATQAREQAETVQKLADEKDKTIATLADKLATAEAKADGYDALKEQAQAAETALAKEKAAHEADAARAQEAADRAKEETERRLADAAKDAEIARLTAQNEADKQISAAQDKAKELEQRLKDTEKDAEIARLKAQSEADKQIADLQARVERLTAELAAAQKGHKAQNKPESGAEDSEKRG